VREGESDYHGRDYETWTNRTVLVPFGDQSRRIDDYTIWYDRTGVRADGSGKITMRAGFTGRSRGLPLIWKRTGRNVLGMSPSAVRGFQKILRSYRPAVRYRINRKPVLRPRTNKRPV
jgi:hypothetical protein